MNSREYEDSHKWLTFKFDLRDVPDKIWITLGEILSKVDHVSGAPLQPAEAQQLNLIYLSKGIHATTSIEGNTLSEEEVAQRVEGHLKLPESLEYQGEEVDNLMEALNMIRKDFEDGTNPPLTVDRIKNFNSTILKNQPLEEGVVPGEFRKHSVVVGDYRGAPAQDCDYLMDEFVKFINDDLVTDHSTYEKPVAVLRAILAHLYLAWIHPFGDGNGRTARLVETQLLFEAGFPTPAAHLLSDFYNRTRSMYYKKLRYASKAPNLTEGLIAFCEYAVGGLVDGLREQVRTIEDSQLEIAWINFIHEQFIDEPHTAASRRRRELALAIPYVDPASKGIPKGQLTQLNVDLAKRYASTTSKTITRDVNFLLDKQLIVQREGGYSSNLMLMAAFLPPVPQL